jgi:hypothetical protein
VRRWWNYLQGHNTTANNLVLTNCPKGKQIIQNLNEARKDYTEYKIS